MPNPFGAARLTLFFTVPKVLFSTALLTLTSVLCAEEAERARLAVRSLLLDVAVAGQRLVAVGERGHVLLSDDAGHHWRQAGEVPTQSLLTGVCFMDEKHGIVVGHDQVVLITSDAGEHWKLAHYAPQAQQPLLDVWCGREGRAIAVGAYASYFESADSGTTWMERKFAPQRVQSASAEEEDEFAGDPHLNRIVAASPDRLFIAAEAGHLYRSDDRGVTWKELPSPYAGSFFGVLPLDDQALLAYGLRGRLSRSDDAGESWRKIETGTVAMLNDAVRMPDGRIIVLGLSGSVLISTDSGKTFTLLQRADRKGISAGISAGTRSLIAVGEGGVKTIP